MKMNVIFYWSRDYIVQDNGKSVLSFYTKFIRLKYKRSKPFFVCLLISVQSAIVNSFRGSAKRGSRSSKICYARLISQNNSEIAEIYCFCSELMTLCFLFI